MNHKLLKEFKTRWRRTRAFQEKETRTLSIAQKFHQLSSLAGLAIALKMSFKEDEEKIKTRLRWILLKKALR